MAFNPVWEFFLSLVSLFISAYISPCVFVYLMYLFNIFVYNIVYCNPFLLFDCAALWLNSVGLDRNNLTAHTVLETVITRECLSTLWLHYKRRNKSIVLCALAPSSGSYQLCICLPTVLLCIHEAVVGHVSSGEGEDRATGLANQYANLSLGWLRNVATAGFLVWTANRQKVKEMREKKVTSSKGKWEKEVEEVLEKKKGGEIMYHSFLIATISIKCGNCWFIPAFNVIQYVYIHTPDCADRYKHLNTYIRDINEVEHNIKAGTQVTPMHTHEHNCIKPVIQGHTDNKCKPLIYLHIHEHHPDFMDAQRSHARAHTQTPKHIFHCCQWQKLSAAA